MGDPDERDGSVTLEVTLQVTQGTLTVNMDVPGGVQTVGGNGTGTVVLIGTPTRINQTLAHPTGVVYLGKLNYNDFSLDGIPDPNEVLVVTVTITLTGEDGDPEVVQVLTFALVGGPSYGTLTGFNPATGQVTYTPDPDFAGTDTFTFTVTDDHRAGQHDVLHVAQRAGDGGHDTVDRQ